MTQIFCDLCGQPLYDGKKKAKNFKIKQHRWFGDFGGWVECDVHEDCVKKLFEAISESEYIFPKNSDHRKQRGRTAPNTGDK